MKVLSRVSGVKVIFLVLSWGHSVDAIGAPCKVLFKFVITMNYKRLYINLLKNLVADFIEFCL